MHCVVDWCLRLCKLIHQCGVCTENERDKHVEAFVLRQLSMKVLGEGEYGRVRLIKLHGKKYALKESELGVFPDNIEVVMACLREQAMNCEHKYIIKRYWSRFWKCKFQLCMEVGVPVEQAPGHRIMHDIGQALCFMHSKGFLHRDVKPGNIVRVGNVFKLIDFGLSRKTEGTVRMSGYMWSRWFRPPELLRLKDFEKHEYDGRSDMWSLGLTAFFIQNGFPLFYGSAEQILAQYSEFHATGILSHLICEYEDRWTAKEMFESNDIEIIDGTMSEVEERTGNVADFVQCLLEGREQACVNYSHEKIYCDL